MAEHIFIETDYLTIQNRIQALTADHHRRWGTMTLNEMLEHCAIQLKLALGKIEQKHFEGPSIQRSRFIRWAALYAVPWFRGLPTPSRMNTKRNQVQAADLETGKEQLLALLDEVQLAGDLKPHPFFGSLNRKDWGRLIWKHLDHHLRQFGV